MLAFTWIIFGLFVLLFTSWGWRLVLIPVGRVLIPIVFKTLMFLTWTGFAAGVLLMPVTYRTFGWDLTDVVLAELPEAHARHRRTREEDYNLSGMYEPRWRERSGLAPLPADWDGEGEHLLPTWSMVPIGGGLLVLAYIGMRRLRLRDDMRIAGAALPVSQSSRSRCARSHT